MIPCTKKWEIKLEFKYWNRKRKNKFVSKYWKEKTIKVIEKIQINLNTTNGIDIKSKWNS